MSAPETVEQYLDPVSTADALAKSCYWSDWTALRPFLMASVQRLSASSLLRHLPTELLQRIAQLAYCPRLRPKLTGFDEPWFLSADESTAFLSTTFDHGFSITDQVLQMPPGSGIQYLEIELIPWLGTQLSICSVVIEFATDENGADDVVLVYGYHVADWTFTWSGLNTFGLLLNLDAGTVRLSCNGVRGPEKELGGQWQKGVAITLGDNLPDTQFYPEHDDEGVLPDDKSGGRAYSSKLAFSVPEAIPAFLSAGGFAVDLAEYDCRNAGCSYCADQEAVAAAEQDAEAEANA